LFVLEREKVFHGQPRAPLVGSMVLVLLCDLLCVSETTGERPIFSPSASGTSTLSGPTPPGV